MAVDLLPAAFGKSWASAQDRWNRVRLVLGNFPRLVKPAPRVIMAGQVSALGVVVAGEGFTSEKTAVGKYTVKITTALASVAIPVLNFIGEGTFGWPTVVTPTTAQFKVETRNAAGALADQAFTFQLLG